MIASPTSNEERHKFTSQNVLKGEKVKIVEGSSQAGKDSQRGRGGFQGRISLESHGLKGQHAISLPNIHIHEED